MDEFKSALAHIFSEKSVVWIVFMALWGGTANYINRLKQDDRKFKLAELFGEWTISGFAGMLTAYVCQEFEFSWAVTCFMAGIAGHMGGRAIFIFETKFKRTMDK